MSKLEEYITLHDTSSTMALHLFGKQKCAFGFPDRTFWNAVTTAGIAIGRSIFEKYSIMT